MAQKSLRAMWRDARAARAVQRGYLARAAGQRIQAMADRASGRPMRAERRLEAALLLEHAAVEEMLDRQPPGLGS